MELYNSKENQKQHFLPEDWDKISMYACGPTVYSYAHIGNARSAVAADVLFKLLKHIYPQRDVTYVRNITDIDDKIIDKAITENVSIKTITDKYTDIYHADLKALHCDSPTHEPRATDNIDNMLQIINTLIEKGHAYIKSGHVLFDVSTHPDYGKISGRTTSENIVSEPVPHYKKNHNDFVLWKPSKDGHPSWNSEIEGLGSGRPGWHIECSAMIKSIFSDDTIDIHFGGKDLLFPHHENESAQSSCAHGNDLANFWLHNGFVSMDNDKMSKSLGNIVLIKDLLNEWDGEVIRYALMSAHYRSDIAWSDNLLKSSKSAIQRLYRAVGRMGAGKVDNYLLEAMTDDMNTPVALSILSQLASKSFKGDRDAASQLKASANLLGFLYRTEDEWFKSDEFDSEKIESMIKERDVFKQNGDYVSADSIRDELSARGIVLEDNQGITNWRIA